MSNNNNNSVVDDENKERLTSEEFSDLIPHLSFTEILQIEILLTNNTTWQTFIESVVPNRLFRCTLCNVKQALPKNIITHISGKKHQSQMQQRVKEIFHAEYTYPKSTDKLEMQSVTKSKLQATNLNINTEKNISKPAEKPKENIQEESSTQKLVKNPLAVKISAEKTNLTTLNKTIETTKEKTIVKPTITTEVTEIVVIDDDDDDDEEMPVVNNTTKNDKEKNVAKEIIEPPAKKQRTSEEFPKIMIASNLKTNEKEKEIKKNNNQVMETSTSSSPIKKPSKLTNNVDDHNDNDDNVQVDDKNKVHGFVGVEYVVKIIGGNFMTNYECGLCELKLSFNDMQNHLLGYSHRLKFCEKHFPTAIQQFRQYIVDVPADEHYKVMIPVLQKLAEAIEKHHGLSKPFVVNFRRYERERIRVLTEVFERLHASEKDGPTFTHVVNSKDVDKFISQRHKIGQQTKTVTGLLFDNMKSNNESTTSINKTLSSKRSLEIDSAPIVKMANEMRMHFQLSQPYHVDGIYPGHITQMMSGNGMPQQSYMQQQQPQPYHMGVQPTYTDPAYMPQSQQLPTFQQQSFVDDETHKRMVESFLRANNKSSNHHGHGHGSSSSTRTHHNERNRYDFSRKIQHSRTTPPRELHVNPQHDIWRSYCRLVDHKLDALNERFKQYKENPESHPSYKEEWLKFWNRRKAELIALGKDYRTFDYQPEWVKHFNRRIREIYEEDFQALKIQSREELSLPFTNEYLKDMKYHVESLESEIRPKSRSLEEVRNPKRSHVVNENVMITKPTITKSEKPSTSTAAASASASLKIEDEQTPTFVSVLRLLVALEEHLGSLGPKIVELLTKVLQAEKSSPAHGIALINDENCSLLETAMEKFKGLVITGILDSSKERALKKAITKVNIFLKVAKELKEKTKELVSKRPTQTHIIEEKLAAALTAHGATNFDHEHLEELATVCLLLDQKKKETATVENRNKKTLSDTLSDIMDNVNSTEIRRHTATTTTNFPIQQSSSSSSYSMRNYNNNNDNRVLNSERNFGNTYDQNNFSNNRNMNNNNERMMPGWQQQQQFIQQRQQQQQRPQEFEQQNWNQNSNQNWSNNRQSQNFPNPGNRLTMRQPPSYRYN